LFKREHRSPRRIGRGLRVKLRKVEPHSRGSHKLNRDSKILSRGGNDRISKEITLMPIHFLVLEVEAEVEEESSHVLRVGKTT
jgi:hypothetical protein